VTTGDDDVHLEGFAHEPWPSWTFRLPDGNARRARALHARRHADGLPLLAPARARLRPGRRRAPSASHGAAVPRGPGLPRAHAENGAFSFEPERAGDEVRFHPYVGGPLISISSNGAYRHEPFWYRSFVYEEERRRGLDCEEDLASPGRVDVRARRRRGRARLRRRARRGHARRRGRDAGRGPRLGARAPRRLGQPARSGRGSVPRRPWRGPHDHRGLPLVRRLGARHVHRAARALPRARALRRGHRGAVDVGRPRLRRHAAQLFSRRDGRTRVQHGRRLALGTSSPSRRPSRTAARRSRRPSADASARRSRRSSSATRTARATAIRATDDGLLAAGAPGQQLTWMDARVDGREVTPRVGKPVEVQALWLNALAAAVALGRTDGGALARALRARPRQLRGSLLGRRARPACTTSSTATTCPER